MSAADSRAGDRMVAPPTPGDADDVVFTFSFETYTDAVRRGMMRPPDRIAASLMSSPQVRRLLIANPFRWAPRVMAGPLLDRDARFPAVEDRWLLSPMRLRRSDRPEAAAVERAYAAYDAALARGAARRELRDPLVLTTNPLVAGYAPLDWARSATYFARDDWLSSPGREEYWDAFRGAYSRIAASGRAVTAVSQQIIDRIAPTGPHEVVPNGVEPAEWQGARPEPPRWFAEIPGPRAVYVGTLDSRLDVPGIVTLARARPRLQIVLLGPLPDRSYVADAAALPNVHVHPSVGRAELVATLRNAELCLVAHRRTPLTEAMSPLKLYEYLAAGCPVLSIDLPPVRGIDDRVFLVDSVSDFVEVVDDALDRGGAAEDERMRFVDQNSWTARHETIFAIARRAA